MTSTMPKIKSPISAPSPSKEEWFEYRLQRDERFLRRIDSARKSLRAGRGTRLEDIKS
jgi:hypothetical protein